MNAFSEPDDRIEEACGRQYFLRHVSGFFMLYSVFISHGWHDRWIAKQMARLISDVGATPFIDFFDIKRGDRIEPEIQRGTLLAEPHGITSAERAFAQGDQPLQAVLWLFG